MSDEEKMVGELRTIISQEPRLLNVLLETKPLLVDFPFRKNMLTRARDIATLVRDPQVQNSSIAFSIIGSAVGLSKAAFGFQGFKF